MSTQKMIDVSSSQYAVAAVLVDSSGNVLGADSAIFGNVVNAIAISGTARGTDLSISSTAAQTAALSAAGFYDIWATTDCYIKVAAVANDVTTLTGYLLRQGNTITVAIPTAATLKIGAITASASGTLSFQQVG